MRSVLIYVDGSAASEAAVRCVAMNVRTERIASVHLLNVQPRLDGYVGRFLSRTTIRRFQRDEGTTALAAAKNILAAADIAYTLHVRAGGAAEEIVVAAAELGVDEIVLGADGLGPFGRLWFRLLAGQVIQRANRPVMIVKSPRPRPQPGIAPEQEKLRPAFSR